MWSLPDLAEIESIAPLVQSVVPPTPQYTWPRLNARAGCELWVKHENHTPVAAFKVRGGLVYFDRLLRREPKLPGVIAATRGNHGQSVSFGARRHRLPCTIVVPHGNSADQNSAMRANGATLIEYGDDFQAAFDHARQLASETGFYLVPSFHRDLVCGVAVSMLDFFRRAPALEIVYVPIGLGSGICATIAARDALGLSTKIVGVCAERAPAIALSFETRRIIPHPVSTRIADGLACSTPHAEAFPHILAGADRIVRVSDDEIEAALRACFADTHNVIEGAAASSLAAVLQEKSRHAGRRVGAIFSGANIDSAVLARVLAA